MKESGVQLVVKGGLREENGKWGAFIEIIASDGESIMGESGFIYDSRDEAVFALEFKVNDIIETVKKNASNVEVDVADGGFL